MVTPTQPISVQHFDALYSLNCYVKSISGGGSETQENLGVKLISIHRELLHSLVVLYSN